uniref:Peptide-N(4)-(N-acetyl-beta-glucosaminyl)asparagine amidase n=1 Tax=Elaeophora elaphi TaxID=1147741 RepID=A0A0R3RQ64_9BILA
MVVRELPDDFTFSQFIAEAATKLVVIDFYADWCGPCRMISSHVERLSEKYMQAVFIKINVEICRRSFFHFIFLFIVETSIQFGINAMPTFVFLYSGREVDRMMGANVEMLETKIVQQLKEGFVATSDERIFLEKFVEYSQRMQIYEDEISQALARSLIPCDKLMEASMVNGKTSKFELVKLLLNWFKTDFFVWTDVPKCELCGQNTEKSGEVISIEMKEDPTEEERKWGACRVEVYKCRKCDTNVRFPRYNDPVKLLETRSGRCGEWANCFTLCSRSLGLETRWIYDVTDHVWCEIWIEDLDRWVHCDPCENVIDTPLLYEKGWGKNLNYVFAFGLDHIRDVTWRYTFNHLETLNRRNSCRETVLRNFIRKLNMRYASLMSEERKKEMERRCMKELVEFISPTMQIRDGSEVEEQGRTTGSEEWRKQRGEIGNGKSTGRVLVPTEKEISDRVFRLKPIPQRYFSLEYDCAKDQYRRGVDLIKGLESLLSKQQNVCRMVDQTNNVAYICCQEGRASGELCWSFDFGGQHVKNIELRLDSVQKVSDDVMRAIICCGDMCTVVPPTGELELETIGGSKVDVKIYFLSEDAQLFLTNLCSEDCASFRMKAFF